MSELLIFWKTAAAEAVSFRQMYILASEVLDTRFAPSELRLRARRVVKTLRRVIDLPIADAKVLAKARQQFKELVEVFATL